MITNYDWMKNMKEGSMNLVDTINPLKGFCGYKVGGL